MIGDNLDSVLHDDALIKLMLLTLVREDRVKGMGRVLSESQMETAGKDLEERLLDDIQGINYLV